jgi:hypothetical protein
MATENIKVIRAKLRHDLTQVVNIVPANTSAHQQKRPEQGVDETWTASRRGRGRGSKAGRIRSPDVKTGELEE